MDRQPVSAITRPTPCSSFVGRVVFNLDWLNSISLQSINVLAKQTVPPDPLALADMAAPHSYHEPRTLEMALARESLLFN